MPTTNTHTMSSDARPRVRTMRTGSPSSICVRVPRGAAATRASLRDFGPSLAPPPRRSGASCTDERATPHARPAQIMARIPGRASAPPRPAPPRLAALAVLLYFSLLGPLVGHADGQCVIHANADLGLVIDGSRSISPEEWESVVGFLSQVVDRLPIGEEAVRTGLVSCEQRTENCVQADPTTRIQRYQLDTRPTPLTPRYIRARAREHTRSCTHVSAAGTPKQVTRLCGRAAPAAHPEA